MPNWAEGTISVTGRKESVLNFTRRFIYEDVESHNKDAYFFARSFPRTTWGEKANEIEDLYNGLLPDTEATYVMNVDFAWSAHKYLLDGYPTRFPDCASLGDACMQDSVTAEIHAEETDTGFEEYIACGKTGNVTYHDQNMPTYVCPACGCALYLSSHTDIDEYVCPYCENVGFKPQSAG